MILFAFIILQELILIASVVLNNYYLNDLPLLKSKTAIAATHGFSVRSPNLTINPEGVDNN
jgi:NhaP-type Na+/H+ or K+/H+ antiporter